MKMMVKLAVLFATLLLVTGVASADWCSCYEITCTNLDIDMVIADHPVVICGDPNGDNEFYFNGLCNNTGTTITFFDSMKDQMLVYDSSGNVGYLKFHGDEGHVVKGIGYCSGFRWNLRGREAEDSSICDGMWPDSP
jgi:hypothetical protein